MTHYLLVAFVPMTNGQTRAITYPFQATNEDAAWEEADRYLDQRQVTVVEALALEGFPTVHAVAKALENVSKTIMGNLAPGAQVNVFLPAACAAY